MNIVGAWKRGYTGKNVVVTILDDGIERNHPDLIENYDSQASFDVNGNDYDPMPRYDASNENKHGTRCAGEVAASANNSHCTVGIAYNAKIGGGRKGRGSIFVWASGNGGRSRDHCSCDGYTNSIYTISISSTAESGKKPWYLEECSSTLTTTYSSGESYDRKIITTDLRQRCTDSHTGTSASAPMAAGIIALALEAKLVFLSGVSQCTMWSQNRSATTLRGVSGDLRYSLNRTRPFLTWRDVQHIIVRTSSAGHLSAPDWKTNAAGYKVSHLYGFGLMDAEAMVQEAERWKAVPTQHICVESADRQIRTIRPENVVRSVYKAPGCADNANHHVIYLEHVVVRITITHHRRGDLSIYLTSPSGTKSQLLANSMSPQLIFWCTHFLPPFTGKLKEWSLVLYGTSVHPYSPRFASPKVEKPRSPVETTTPDYSEYTGSCDTECSDGGCDGPGPHQCIDCLHYFLKFKNHTRTCVSECPSGFFRDDKRRCKKCYSLCDACVGSRSDQCTSCKPGYHLNEETYSCVSSCPESFYLDKGNLQGSKCLITCDAGTYYNAYRKECEICHKACAACAGTGAEACTECAKDYYMEDWRCVLSCSAGYYLEQSSENGEKPNTCRKKIAFLGSCRSHSAIKWFSLLFPEKKRLETCALRLFDDVGQGPTSDRKGKIVMSDLVQHRTAKDKFGNNRYLFQGECKEACPQGYYPSAEKICQLCPDNCEGLQRKSLFLLHDYCSAEPVVSSAKPIYLMCFLVPEAAEQPAFKVAPSPLAKKAPVGRKPLSFPILSPEATPQTISPTYQKCEKCNRFCKTCTAEKKCTSCRTGRYLTAHQSCVTTCPEKTFANLENGKCEVCAQGCAECSKEKNNCQKCLDIPKHPLYLHEGKCLSKCPSGYFEDVETCTKCIPECKACKYDSTSCQACHQDYVLYQNRCMTTCPDEHFPAEGHCKRCTPGCKKCVEHGICSECNNHFFLHLEVCVDKCPVDFYEDTQSQTCSRCHSDCAECDGPDPDECVSCADSSAVLYGGQCFQECPDGTYHDMDTGDCQDCDRTCQTCKGSSSSDCITCIEGMVKNKQGHCVTHWDCPLSSYQDKRGVCRHCHKSCHLCTGPTQHECLSCTESHYLLNNTCLVQCPDGYYKDEDGWRCVPCHSSCGTCSGQYECSRSCDTGYYFNASTEGCLRCHPSCKVCVGSEHTDCVTCQRNYFFLRAQGRCYFSCPEGYYKNSDEHTCVRCHPTCKTCKGYLSTLNCIDTVSGYLSTLNYIDTVSVYLSTLKLFRVVSKQYRYETYSFLSFVPDPEVVCKPCDDSCIECKGSGPNNCTECPASTLISLEEGRCLYCCDSPLPQPVDCCNCTESREECIVRPRFILKQMEYTDRPALFISSSILVILSLGGGVFFFLRSRSKAQPKEKSGYEKLANSSKPISSFDPKRASVGSSYRQEHVIEYRDRVEKEEEEEDDEDEDIVYMGQDGTVYRKFKYGLLEDDDDEELEYDDESYSFI
ncbi:UNVERIFIED_CONTAM: hypothetical protein FKN15_031152 [Acipenser sinensis]